MDMDWADPGDTVAELQAIQRAAIASGKAWEYNYVIGADRDPNIYEYAGPYRGAHSAGENDLSIGVLFLLGTGNSITRGMVRKARWLRYELTRWGVLAPTNRYTPHQGMPGAATLCPGASVLGSGAELSRVWDPDTDVAPAKPIDSDILAHYSPRTDDTPASVSARLYQTVRHHQVVPSAQELREAHRDARTVRLPVRAHLRPELVTLTRGDVRADGSLRVNVIAARQMLEPVLAREISRWNRRDGNRPGDPITIMRARQ
jgi:hypothetical protein